MKRANRERALESLMAELRSRDFDTRENALFQLAILLRRAQDERRSADWTDLAGEQLPRRLQRFRLSAADLERVALALTRVASRHAESEPTVSWALGEFPARAGVAFAMKAIAGAGRGFTDEEALQICRALRGWLLSCASDSNPAGERSRDYGAMPLLRRWAASSHSQLAASAGAVIRLMQESTA